MMAKQHVTFASAVYLTSVAALSQPWSVGTYTSPAPLQDWSGAQPLQLALSVLLVSGFALVPDLDHPNSTLTKRLGVFGSILYPFIRLLSGGHRKGMHSWVLVLLVAAFFTALTASTNLAQVAEWVTALMIWFLGLVVFRFIIPGSWGQSANLAVVVVGGLIVAAFVMSDDILSGYWVPVAAASGTLLHDVGDMLTKGKVRFFWPFSDAAIQSPLAFRTGSAVETWVVGPVCTVATLVLVWLTIVQPLSEAGQGTVEALLR